jgi:drug/metabolite transporter (DMT)-like permease
MTRKFVLFAALFFVALVAGAAFAIWFDYDPSGMSAAFYTEKMQHAIKVFTIPLPTVVVLGVLFTIAAAFLARSERPNFFLLIAASVCIIGVALITRFGNIPINNRILMWSISSPPSDWAEFAAKWWQLQTARALAALAFNP